MSVQKCLDKIRKAIGNDHPIDRVGTTLGCLLATEIESSSGQEWIDFQEAINKMTEDIPMLNVDQMKNLTILIQAAETPSEIYRDNYFRALKEWETPESNMEQRAELFRLVGEAGHEFSDKTIEEEWLLLRENYPWHWVDGVDCFTSYRSKLIERIKEILQKHGTEGFMSRIALWYDDWGKETLFRAMSIWAQSFSEEYIKLCEEALRDECGFSKIEIKKCLKRQ